ncbi:hypothetical protein GGX14DRAFT_561952 [Mycena pura]|uniref:Uncharacterized protein n=1 Tax=Mycena pura TaxID=153505 RepID=A0AAD6YF53_9AGAR|nr:hypothetical protein GGX14DRAFT_561952 [Mycena pura]
MPSPDVRHTSLALTEVHLASDADEDMQAMSFELHIGLVVSEHLGLTAVKVVSNTVAREFAVDTSCPSQPASVVDAISRYKLKLHTSHYDPPPFLACPMGRWTQYDEDSYRLPAGMVRTGYDADTGQYYFSDRSGMTYAGEAGSQYSHMYPVNSQPPLPVDTIPSKSEESRRRASLPSAALRTLRRSLTTVRKPWRRDQSPSSDDEEPVLVSRPSSPISGPRQTAETAHAVDLGPVSKDTSPPPYSASSKTSKPAESRRSRSAVPHPPPKPSEDLPTRSDAKSVPSTTPPPPPKSTAPRPPSKPAHGSASPRPTSLSVPARATAVSVSAAAGSRSRTRRATSEHVHSPRAPHSTRPVPPARVPAVPTPIYDALHTVGLPASDLGGAAPQQAPVTDAATRAADSDVRAGPSTGGRRRASAHTSSASEPPPAPPAKTRSLQSSSGRRVSTHTASASESLEPDRSASAPRRAQSLFVAANAQRHKFVQKLQLG